MVAPSSSSRGVDHRLVTPWRELLDEIDEEMLVWGRTFKKVYGTDLGSATRRDEDDEAVDVDPYGRNGDEGENDWDQREIPAEGEVTA